MQNRYNLAILLRENKCVLVAIIQKFDSFVVCIACNCCFLHKIIASHEVANIHNGPTQILTYFNTIHWSNSQIKARSAVVLHFHTWFINKTIHYTDLFWVLCDPSHSSALSADPKEDHGRCDASMRLWNWLCESSVPFRTNLSQLSLSAEVEFRKWSSRSFAGRSKRERGRLRQLKIVNFYGAGSVSTFSELTRSRMHNTRGQGICRNENRKHHISSIHTE